MLPGGRGRGVERGAEGVAPGGLVPTAELADAITLLQNAVAPIPQIQTDVAGLVTTGAAMQAAIAGLVATSATMQADIAGLTAAATAMQGGFVGIQAVLGLGAVDARRMELRHINRILRSDEPLCPLPDGGAVYPPAFWPVGLCADGIALLGPAQINALLAGYGLPLVGAPAVKKQLLYRYLCS
jgi:hypothetical protein